MTTLQESPNGHHPYPPLSVESPADLNRAELPTNKANNSQFPANAYHVPPKPFTPNPKLDQPNDYSERAKRLGPLPERCQFMFSDGRQCTMARSDIHPSLCVYHSDREEQLFGDPSCRCEARTLDFPELYSASNDLTTAAGVNRALGQVFRLLAQRRISRQEAATFGHLAQLLLRTISLMRSSRESHGDQELSRVNEVSATSADHYVDNAVILSSGESPAANVYLPTAEVYQQDELPPCNKAELRGVNTGAPLGRAKVYPQDELLRGKKDHQELSPVNLSSGESHGHQELSPVNKVQRRISPELPPDNNGPSRCQPAPINAHPSPPPMAPAAVSQAMSEPITAKNSFAISTSATPVGNSGEINKYENAALKTLQNQHLHKNGG